MFSLRSTYKDPVLLLFIIKFFDTDSKQYLSHFYVLTSIWHMPAVIICSFRLPSARKIMSRNILDHIISYSSIYSFPEMNSVHNCGLFELVLTFHHHSQHYLTFSNRILFLMHTFSKSECQHVSERGKEFYWGFLGGMHKILDSIKLQCRKTAFFRLAASCILKLN